MESIAVLDDSPAWLSHIGTMLSKAGYTDVALYKQPGEAMIGLKRRPVQLLLLDYVMPDLDGLGFLQAWRQEGAPAPGMAVAMMTGEGSFAALKPAAFQAGALDVLVKPIHPRELTLKVGQLLRTAPASEGHFQPGLQSLLAARQRGTAAPAPTRGRGDDGLRLLQAVLQLRGQGLRQRRIAHFSAAIARALGLGLAEQEQLLIAAPLLDVGHLALPHEVDFLALRTAASSREGRQRLQRHTLLGHALLAREAAPELQLAAEIALSHHEQWNGQGYPRGLSQDQIPLSGRIVAVADAFEMITAQSVDADEAAIERASAVIGADAGEAFDPAVVAAFQAALPYLGRLHRTMLRRPRALELDDGPVAPQAASA